MKFQIALFALLSLSVQILTAEPSKSTSKPISKAVKKSARKPSSGQQEPAIAIMSTDGGDEIEGMDPQAFKTFNRERKSEILPPEERDALLRKAGITAADVQGMDHLDRDLLYLNSKSRPPEDLYARYPHIARAKLYKLMQITRARP
jgi:hypothetical protein